MTSFTQHDAFEIHSCCHVYRAVMYTVHFFVLFYLLPNFIVRQYLFLEYMAMCLSVFFIEGTVVSSF